MKLGRERDRFGSPATRREAIPLEQRLEGYRALGTQGVVCFDADELRIRLAREAKALEEVARLRALLAERGGT